MRKRNTLTHKISSAHFRCRMYIRRKKKHSNKPCISAFCESTETSSETNLKEYIQTRMAHTPVHDSNHMETLWCKFTACMRSKGTVKRKHNAQAVEPTDRKPSNLRRRHNKQASKHHTSNSVAVRVSERESTNCVWWKRVSSKENEKRVARPLLECRNNTITRTRARGTHKPRRSLVLAFKCHQQYSICHHTVWDRDRVSGALSLNQNQSHFSLASVSFL